MENKEKDKQKQKQREKQKLEIEKMRKKYYEFYDDVKNHNNGYEDW